MTPAKRVMALDYGTKRIGVAVSDPLGITAQPVGKILRRNIQADLKEIQERVREYNVRVLVVGLPRRTDGTEGPEAKAVRDFIEKLGKVLDIEIDTWDEWFTTREAQRVLIDAGVRRERRKEAVDSMAASLILQGWMEANG